MPSKSLISWRSTGARALNEIEAAHRAVGGIGPGRRYATQQINHAYTVLLSSQFQRFCRDLQSEAADELAGTVAMPVVRDIFRVQLTTWHNLAAPSICAFRWFAGGGRPAMRWPGNLIRRSRYIWLQ
jgi:hypothetical protein